MLRLLLIFACASLGFSQMNCGPNEVFDTCGSACEPSCRNPNPTICTLQCVVGCRCRQGFFRDDFGQCVASCGPPGPPPQSAPSQWVAPAQPGSSLYVVPTPTSCLGAICPSETQCLMVAEPCPFISCAVPTPKCVPLSSRAAPSQPLPAPIPTSCFEAQCVPGTVCEMVIEPCFFIYCAVPRPMCVSSAQSRSPRSSNRGPSPPVQAGPTSPPSKPSPVPNPPSPSRPSPIPAPAPAPKPTPVIRPPSPPRPSPTPAPPSPPKPTAAPKPPSLPRPSPTPAPPPPPKPTTAPKPPSPPRPSPTPAPPPPPKPTAAPKPPSPPRPSPTPAPPPPPKPLPVPKPPSPPQPSSPSPPGRSPQCPRNESWRKCPTQCEPTCSNMNPKCNKACGEPKCQCDEGFYRNRSGSCVRSSECPRRDSRESREIINSRESHERRRG